MNSLIIDIRETGLRAIFRNDAGKLEYSRSFEFKALTDLQTKKGENQPISINDVVSNNPYLLEFHNLWNLNLKDALKTIRSEIRTSIDATHLILPPYEVITATHQLPRMSRQDAEKLIGRKIIAESREEFPPFSIVAGASDQKTQIWNSLYIPSSTLKLYRKAFASSRLRLASITTPVNAMLNAFQGVRESIFNAHAVFEIQLGFVEAYYISSEGILYFERRPLGTPSPASEGKVEEIDRISKFRLFKIINTIFSINSNYQNANPQVPVQMAWLCGLESGLGDIATALKETMGVETGIAPATPTGLPDESGYVPLSGFSTALLNGTSTSYEEAPFFKRIPFRKTSFGIIYSLSIIAALLVFTFTEREYRKLQTQVRQSQLNVNPNQNLTRSSATAAYTKNLATLKNLTSRQFIFYNLFRELANGLPEDVYLENLEFHLKDDKGLLDITALTDLGDKSGSGKPLRKFIEMLDRSPILTDHLEPAISVVVKDKKRYLKITITSEVSPLDTSN